MSWQAKAVKDVAELAIGPFGSALKADTYVSEGMPVVAGGNLGAGRWPDVSSAPRIALETASRLKRSIALPGDLVFPHRGAIGRVGIADRELMLSTSMMRARFESDIVDKEFAYWYFLARGSQELLTMASSVGTPGIGQPLTSLGSVRIEVPPMRVQKSLVEVLGALDDKIAANQSVIGSGLELLDSRFDDARDRSRVTAVSEVAQVVLGGTPSRRVDGYWGGDVPWINSGACNSRIIISASEMITHDGLEKSAAKILPEGTTCVAITGATLGQMGWLGAPMAANQSVVGIVGPPEDRLWLHLAVRAEREQLMGWATGGAQQHVNKKSVGSLAVSYDSASAKNFGNVNRPLMERVVLAEGENEVLSATRDELLPLLMSGKITVKDAEKTVEEVV